MTDRPVSGRDAAFVVAGALVATIVICAMPARPWATCGIIAPLLGLFVARWHTRRDLIGLAVGATLGNATELACDLAGVWVHTTRALFGVAPAYIFLCYPILGLTLPRLIDALVRRPRNQQDGAATNGALAAALWLAHTTLSYRFGTNNDAELVVSAGCLGLTLLRFHTKHDLATGAACAALAMIWELPCTTFGAWAFPHPQWLGLVPAWLPVAYAVFFINLGRVTAALGRAHHSTSTLTTEHIR